MQAKTKKPFEVSQNLSKLDIRIFKRIETIKKIIFPNSRNYFY